MIKSVAIAAVLYISSVAPALASDAQPVEIQSGSSYTHLIAVASPGIRNSDPAINQAVDYLTKSEQAAQIGSRRSKTKPAFDSKVVKHKHEDKILILGGSDVVPM